jgi:hypothetical protein
VVWVETRPNQEPGTKRGALTQGWRFWHSFRVRTGCWRALVGGRCYRTGLRRQTTTGYDL